MPLPILAASLVAGLAILFSTRPHLHPHPRSRTPPTYTHFVWRPHRMDRFGRLELAADMLDQEMLARSTDIF